MKKFWKILVILIIIGIILICTKKDSYENGNISNMGLAIKYKNTVYYNKYEKGIFSVKNDKEKQITDETAYSINIFDDKIYYLTIANFDNILIKCVDINGENIKTIKTIYTSISKIYVDNGYIYYYTNANEIGIAKVDLNGQNESLVVSGNIQDFWVKDGKIFYINNMNKICKYYNEVNIVLNDQINAKKIQVVNGWIYYYDELENALFRIKENGTKNQLISVLVNNEIYNVSGKYVYYLNNEDYKIERMQIGNSNECDNIVDISSTKTKINIAGNQMYYLDKSKNESQTYQIFRVTIDGEKSKEIIYN